MHLQEQLQLLLQNLIVKEPIDILENEGSSVLTQLDPSRINTAFDELINTIRGRPCTYTPDEKLQAFLYGLTEGKRTICGISRCVQTSVVQMFLHLDDSISYATLDRFWHQLSMVAEQVFENLVGHVKQLDILGDRQAADTTSIVTTFQDDPDTSWSYDATKDTYYFGYGLLLVVDVHSELPIAARFIQRKQVLKKIAFK